MKKGCFITLVFTALFLTGCASYNYTDAPPTLGVLYSKYTVIGYDGDIENSANVGVVTTDGLIRIETINGKPVSSYRTYQETGFYSGGRFQLHLKPGTHVLTMSFHDDRGGNFKSWSTSDVSKTITIEKNKIIHFSLFQRSGRWDAIKHDGESARATIERDFIELVNQ